MARVLIGWELGANRGHAGPIAAVGTALAACGHTVIYAVQQVDVLVHLLPADAIVVQAPIWPRLLRSVAQPAQMVTASYAEILVQLGLTEPGTLSALIASWDRLITLSHADLVIADFAPALCLAARGRWPLITMGSSFCQPPARMTRFPAFFGDAAALDQGAVCAAVNTELARAGRSPLAALPQINAADAAITTGFAELDAYRDHRDAPLVSPLPAHFGQIAARGDGTEIFVYFFQSTGPTSALWAALGQTGLPVRVHVSRLDDDGAAQLAGYGFTVEREPIGWELIAARSRMVISHGGMGFVSSALVAGLPQLVAYFDVEKLLTGRAVAQLGLGAHVHALQFDADRGAAAITRLYHNETIAKRCQNARGGFVAQLGTDVTDAAVAAVAALSG